MDIATALAVCFGPVLFVLCGIAICDHFGWDPAGALLKKAEGDDDGED